MYIQTIPVFSHSLTAMSKILAKAEADCTARKIDPVVLLTDRLYPDMLNFTRQIQIATDHARRAPARLAGIEPLSMADTESSFAELQTRLAATIEHLKTFSPEQLDGAETRTITFKAGPRELTMSGQQYLSSFALPNFYFHLTVAHCLMRANGVPIGKTDFLGG